MRALVLVDLQYDFMPGGALAVADGDATVAVANNVMPHFDLVVATQDAHPMNHGSFVTQHPGASIGQVIELDGSPQVVWPVHCVQGERGSQLHDRLDPSRISEVFPKGTDANVDSYSGFFDNGKRKATGLDDALKRRGVTDVFVMGLATDYCVKATALDAIGLGFATHLIVDGCRAVDLSEGDGERAIAEMRAAGVRVLHSDALDGNPKGVR